MPDSDSDYGGYAYRNGERVDGRNNVILGKNDIKRCPYDLVYNDIDQKCKPRHHHVLIGDGPIYVGLNKEDSFTVYERFMYEESPIVHTTRIDPANIVLSSHIDHPDKSVKTKYGTLKLGPPSAFVNDDRPTAFIVDKSLIEFVWTLEDAYYQYVRLTQEDGVVWTAFCGYGVGYEFEDNDYGFSTQERVRQLKRVFLGKKKTIEEYLEE